MVNYFVILTVNKVSPDGQIVGTASLSGTLPASGPVTAEALYRNAYDQVSLALVAAGFEAGDPLFYQCVRNNQP
jgi:hypothetical protein